MNEWKVDVPVLLIFFCRPQTTAKVFEQIKLARPSKLFLFQDGPRTDRPDDLDKVMECRRIVEDIDWECEVYKCYHEKNIRQEKKVSFVPSVFIAFKWAFSHVDRCIVLEDDDVPAQSFFPFCTELLERYKDDERINMICGWNFMGERLDIPYDYFFSVRGATGWATWKRVIDEASETYDFLDDEYALKQLVELPGCFRLSPQWVNMCTAKRLSKVAHHEAIFGGLAFLNSRLNIIPSRNMISNIGIGEDATHTQNECGTQASIFNMKTHEICFPLRHPKYVINDSMYCDFAQTMPSSFVSFGKRMFNQLIKLCAGLNGKHKHG